MNDEPKQTETDPLGKVVSFFGSVWLTLGILAAIAVLSFFGVTGWKGMGNIYHTKPFQILLGLLFTNLLVCTIDRLPGAWRRMRMDMGPVAPPPPGKADYLFKAGEGDLKEVLEKAEALVFPGKPGTHLRREMEIPVKKKGAGKDSEAAVEKRFSLVSFISTGKIAILGPHVTHLGILITIVGGLIGSMYPFKGDVWLFPGEQKDYVVMQQGGKLVDKPLGFTLRCDSFKIVYYKDRPGMPKDYLCDLTVLQNGKEVKSQHIEVNRPLYYEGYGVYQSQYRIASGKIRLIAKDVQSGDTLSAEVGLNEEWKIPNSVESYVVEDYEENATGMGMNLGPKALVAQLKAGQVVGEFYLFQNFPTFDEKQNKRQDRFALSFKATLETGLQVIKDPGLPLVWLGFALIVLGTMQSFFILHRRVWLVAAQTPKGVELRLIGRAKKGTGLLEKRLGQMAAKLGETFTARQEK